MAKDRGVLGGVFALPAPLMLKARKAVMRAEAYIRSRQSPNGGFCFYKSEYVDEPNLHDTYHAVAALTLLRADVSCADELAQFLVGFELFGLNYLYYCAFTLDLLDRASLIDAQRLARIHNLTIIVPHPGGGVVTSAWLEGTLRTLRLKWRFADLTDYPELLGFIDGLKAEGGYGEKPNIVDTYRCLSILSLLGERSITRNTQAFIDRLQVRSFGFTLTGDSLLVSLDVIYAGMRCCTMLGVPVRCVADVLAFVLACQTSHGGFSRVPDALPDIKLTHRALQIIALAEPDISLASA